MAQHKIAVLSTGSRDTILIEQELSGLDYEMAVHVCASEGETMEAVKGADVIINLGPSMPRKVIEEIDRAQAIVSSGHGFDRLDHEAATERNIMVVNTAGLMSEEVSDHTIMLVLACARKLTILHKLTREGKWGPDVKNHVLPMSALDGQTLGLVGFGNIARAAARKAKAFGMEVIASDPYVEPWTAREHGIKMIDSLEELARGSDFVSLLVPLNGETRKMVGAAFFKAMKPMAYFINTCRGPVVDEQALIKALEEGEIAGAGLDVFDQEPTPADNPLLKMDNVIVTPHTAYASDRAVAGGPVQVGQETARILKGMWPLSLVNAEVRAKIEVRKPALNR